MDRIVVRACAVKRVIAIRQENTGPRAVDFLNGLQAHRVETIAVLAHIFVAAIVDGEVGIAQAVQLGDLAGLSVIEDRIIPAGRCRRFGAGRQSQVKAVGEERREGT